MHFGNFTDIKGISQVLERSKSTDMFTLSAILKAHFHYRYIAVICNIAAARWTRG